MIIIRMNLEQLSKLELYQNVFEQLKPNFNNWEKIYKLLEKTNKSTRLIKNEPPIEKLTQSQTENYVKMIHSPFTCPESIKDIELRKNNSYVIDNVVFISVIPGENIRELYNKIACLNEFIKNLINEGKFVIKPKIILFRSILKKHRNNEVLDCCTANSGFSDGIYVSYRCEEDIKVIIHELLHHYQLDTQYRNKTCSNST